MMPTKATILIVEDERIIALDLKQQLEALGYSVCAMVANGEVALQKANELHPDLLLMDIHIEGPLDGIDTARRIYAELRLPVIFLTAYTEDATLQRAIETLPYGYLVKPWNVRELHAAIQTALARHTAESALEQSEERLRLALDAAALGVWEWEVATDRFTIGGHFSTIFGSAPQAIAEPLDTFLIRVHPEERAEVGDLLRQAVAHDRPLHREFRCLCPDGRSAVLEVYAKPQTSVRGGDTRLIGVIKDITTRRQMEERLRQAGAVFETTAEGIYITDRERRIVSVNPAFTHLTGYSATEVLQRDPDDLLRARRHSAPFYTNLEAELRGQWQGEISYQRSDGELFPAWESLSVVRDESGALTHYAVVFADISAIRRVEEELYFLAHHDPLTGLANRVQLHDRIDGAILRAKRSDMNCALLFLDLDDFKVVNDSLGHASGDLLLQVVARRIEEVLRGGESAARLGGDEFVVIMESCVHPEDCARIAERVLATVCRPITLGDQSVSVSCSIGIALYPDDGTDRGTLLKAADTAMYSAKRQGRNRYNYHTAQMALQTSERLEVEQGLRRALECGEFLLHYQPLINLHDGRLTGLEALARWQHPTKGMILPEHFIPIAEESGVIEALGRWVLFTACAVAARWPQEGGVDLYLSVNVSVRQLTQAKFVESVQTALHDSGLAAQRLVIEITESTLLVIEQSQKLLQDLKSLGVVIAIDDFGTGYSSLSVLKHLPIDRLKIDRSFIRDTPDNVNDVAIVTAIIAMSHTLGLQVTAEGVETEAQLAMLQCMNCQEAQGFFFSRPLPLATLPQFFADKKPWAGLMGDD